MNTIALTSIVFFVFSFVSMYIINNLQVKKFVKKHKFNLAELPVIYIFLFYALGSIGTFWLFDNADFVEPLTILRVIVPIIFAAVLYILAMWRNDWVLVCVLIGCLTVNTLMQPIGIGSMFPQISSWITIIGVIFLGTLYCRFYQILNSSTSVICVSQLVTLGGLCFLSYMGAVPVYTALVATIMGGVLLAYLSVNYHEEKISLDNETCMILAYLVWNLILLQEGEFSFSSCLIITAIFWAEFFLAVWGKYLGSGGSLKENTCCYILGQNYALRMVILNLLRVGAIVYFIAWFQLHSSNPYSLFILTFLIVLWLNYAILHPENKAKNLKDINREFVAGLKENLQQVRDAWGKVQDKNDEDK